MKTKRIHIGHSNSLKNIVPITLIVVLSLIASCNSVGSDPSSALEDTAWRLQAFGEEAPPGNQEYSLTFVSESEFGGRNDCNGIWGTYKAFKDGSLRFGDIGTTLMGCVDSKNEKFDRWLQTVDAFEIEGDRLTLSAREGDLIFKRTAELGQ